MARKIVTTTSRAGKFKFTLSQKMCPRFDFGHFYWTMTDRVGNIVKAGFSTCAPPPRKTQAEVDRMAQEALREYLDLLALEEKGDKAYGKVA